MSELLSLYHYRQDNSLCLRCGEYLIEPNENLCDECILYKQTRDLKDLRHRAINIMGSICRCCGEKTREFLHFDHIDGDGKVHRKEIGVGPDILVQWIIDNPIEAEYRIQLLCANCHNAKSWYGHCPHQLAVRIIHLADPPEKIATEIVTNSVTNLAGPPALQRVSVVTPRSKPSKAVTKLCLEQFNSSRVSLLKAALYARKRLSEIAGISFNPLERTDHDKTASQLSVGSVGQGTIVHVETSPK